MPNTFTRSGDEGTTGRLDGERVLKSDPLIEASGTIDECNSLIGLARSVLDQAETDRVLHGIQCKLFVAGADVSNRKRDARFPAITQEDTTELEELILGLEAKMPKLTQFVLPGGCQAAAALHLACTVSRRAERRLVALSREQAVPAELLTYFNRLSDTLFVLARHVQHASGSEDEVWTSDS